MSITVGDYVQTTTEYPISGKVIEDYGNTVVIIDEDAETDDDRLEFHKSDLEVCQWSKCHIGGCFLIWIV